MAAMISRCGYRCDLCPAYKDNNHGPEDRQRTADGWWEYYRERIPPETIYCDGCLADDAASPQRITPDCPVRPCVIEKGLDNCAQCDDCVCDKLQDHIVDGEHVVVGHGRIPKEDYDAFIRAYDNKRRLAEIRSRLQEGGRGDEGK